MKLDGFINIIKSLKRINAEQSIYYSVGRALSLQEQEDLYVYNWLAAKIVDIPVDDAMRKGRELLISDAAQKQEIQELVKKHSLSEKIAEALKWARVYGGAAILAITEDDDLSVPVEPESLSPGQLKNFVVLDRQELFPGPMNLDVRDSDFGRPAYYEIARSGQRVHPSRMGVALGYSLPLRKREQEDGWGGSLFNRAYEPTKNSQTVTQSIADLIYEANVDVYRVNGLNALVAEQKDEHVIKRLQIAHDMKSIYNGIVLDKEDEYEKKSNTFASLADIDDRALQKVAGAANIPVTRLVGVSPSGMNATGESDMLNYYDYVSSIQRHKVRPLWEWADPFLAAEARLQEEIKFDFAPLKQLTEVERADVETKRAQRDQAYLNQQVVTPVDVLAQLAENGTYASVDEARVEAEKAEEGLDI